MTEFSVGDDQYTRNRKSMKNYAFYRLKVDETSRAHA